MYKIMSSANRDNFSPSVLILIIYNFSCLIAVAITSSSSLNRSGIVGHPDLVPYIRGKSFNLLPLSMMLAVGLSYTGLYYVDVFLLCLIC